jgi:hypothetical protein
MEARAIPYGPCTDGINLETNYLSLSLVRLLRIVWTSLSSNVYGAPIFKYVEG